MPQRKTVSLMAIAIANKPTLIRANQSHSQHDMSNYLLESLKSSQKAQGSISIEMDRIKVEESIEQGKEVIDRPRPKMSLPRKIK